MPRLHWEQWLFAACCTNTRSSTGLLCWLLPCSASVPAHRLPTSPQARHRDLHHPPPGPSWATSEQAQQHDLAHPLSDPISPKQGQQHD